MGDATELLFMVASEFIQHLTGLRFRRRGDDTSLEVVMDPTRPPVLDKWREEFFPALTDEDGTDG